LTWTGTQAEPIAEQEFTSFGAPGNQSEFANSQLVDDILRVRMLNGLFNYHD